MSLAITAKLTADLAPLGLGVTELPAVVGENTLGQPESVALLIGGLSAERLRLFTAATLKVTDVFATPAVRITLATGERLDGEIVFVKQVHLAPESVRLECELGSVTRSSGKVQKGTCEWVFGLANYRVRSGDQRTELPLPGGAQASADRADQFNALVEAWHAAFPNSGIPKTPPAKPEDLTLKSGWRLNRITFSFAGRSWTLDDDMHGRWPEADHKITEPVRSGSLVTAFREGDTEAVVQQAVDDITDLLTLALGRDIKSVQCGLRSEDGSFQWVHYRTPGLLAFNQHGPRFADNWETGNLKQFLEQCERVLAANRDWWGVTIGLLMQARGAKYLEVKASLINTLLDRVTTKILGDQKTHEIDPGPDAKLKAKEFKVTLHFILSTLSPNWDRNRTESLCNTIREWNAKPSFPKKITRSCQSLGISPVSGEKLGFRHVLIHQGEMDSDLETPDDRVQYFCELEATVLLLLARMLGFDGHVYLQKDPSSPGDTKPVADFLDAATKPE